MSRILVAGATGFLGRRILEQGARAGHEMVALARPASVKKLDDLSQYISEIETADLQDASALAKAMTGIGAVVTTIGMTRPEKGVDPEQVDFGCNERVLAAATTSGVDHFTYVSLDGIEKPGAADVEVVKQKKRFEAALMDSQLPWAIARPNGFFWNYGISLTMAREHSVMRIVGDGSARTTPIDEDELALAVVNRIGDDKAIYSVGGPEDISFNEIGEMMAAVLGKKIRIRHYPRNMTESVVHAIHPFAPERSDLIELFVWLMNADITSDHVGTRTLEDWFIAHRDETFTI